MSCLRFGVFSVLHRIVSALIRFLVARGRVGWAKRSVAIDRTLFFVKVLSAVVSKEAVRVGDLQVRGLVVSRANHVGSCNFEVLRLGMCKRSLLLFAFALFLGQCAYRSNFDMLLLVILGIHVECSH